MFFGKISYLLLKVKTSYVITFEIFINLNNCLNCVYFLFDCIFKNTLIPFIYLYDINHMR